MIKHDFTTWAYQQWEENCEEHDAYGECNITFDEYRTIYASYLRDEYIKEKNAQRQLEE